VNKSQKKFMPKISTRGPGGRAPARRLSTLRTSFSVPPSSGSSQPPAETEKSPVASIRSQLLGIEPNGAENSESAVEELPPPKRVRIASETDSENAEVTKMTEPTRARLNTSRALPKPGTTLPNATPTRSNMLSPPPASIIRPSVAQSNESAESVVALQRPSQVPEEVKPQAPEGFEYIWPEDIPQRRAEERRRKMAVEREFIATMKSLYLEKEKSRILSENSGMDHDIAQSMAEQAANTATYHQLKQSVGIEAKQQRDASGEVDEEDTSKTLLDVNKFTMASLCKDIPVGDRNTAYDDYELARVNRRRDTARVFRAKMWSRRMYEPKESERPALKEAYQKYQNERKERSGKIKTEQEQKFTEIDDATENDTGGHPQASIEIQANGSISLVGTQFDRHKNNRTQREGGTSGPKTEVDPTEQVINSYSYSTRERPDRWTPEETTKFYEAVSALGTDFNLIAHLFPMRSRNQIKTKYKYEEKRNPAKLQIHLVSRRKFNVDSYSKVSNVAIQDVGSIESELERVRQEHERQMQIEEESRQEAKVEDQQKSKGVQRTLSRPKRERRD